MLAKIVVCLAILGLALAAAPSHSEAQYQGLFRSFIKHHNKVRFVFTP